MTTALDLFAGSGWGVACQRIGIHEHGVEIMPEAIATREAAGMHTAYHDVWLGIDQPWIVPPHDMLIASPPCQTFSAAGSGAGRRALDEVLQLIRDGAHTRATLQAEAAALGFDDRTALVLAPLAYAWQHRPRYIVLEQVPTVLPVWAAYADVLRTTGYSVAYGNLHAEQYGVPQTRKRAILVARNDGVPARLPTPTHSKYHTRTPDRLDPGVLPWVSMAEALGWGLSERPSPTITGGGTETGGAEPIAKLARYTSRADFIRPDGREPWKWAHTPSTTIAGDPRITAREHHYHGEQNSTSYRLEAHEAETLQTFPQMFPFQGTKSKQFLQIGNAVPPLLAEAILRTLI